MVHFEEAPSAVRKPPGGILKLVLELGPLAVFFFANARGKWLAEKLPVLARLGDPAHPENIGIFVATALFVIAVLVSLAVSYAVSRRLPVMPMITGIVVLVFGGLTLWLKDDTFIKMKPTIIDGLFGIILLGGLLFGKALIGYVFNSVFTLSDEGWRTLTLRWGIFFLVLATLNEIVWRSFSTDTWVSFKVFGIMPLTILFTLTQVPLLAREQARAAEAEAAAAKAPGE